MKKHSKNPLQFIAEVLNPKNLRNYKPNIPLYIEKKNFIIKTAINADELHSALKLRHDVFIEELLHKRKRNGIDVDRFDRHCDHLLIIDKKSNSLIGTYRMQSSLHTKKWYTATEFHMRHIRKLPGNKLELGRACVHPAWRNGVTITLLWEGIHAYMTASDTKYMFGCSSIKTTDPSEIRAIYQYMKQQNYLTEEHKVRPRSRFHVHGIRKLPRRRPAYMNHSHEDIAGKIPGLLQSYIKAGAKVCGTPALDRSFRCIDFLTLMDVSEFREQYARRNKQGSAAI